MLGFVRDSCLQDLGLHGGQKRTRRMRMLMVAALRGETTDRTGLNIIGISVPAYNYLSFFFICFLLSYTENVKQGER